LGGKGYKPYTSLTGKKVSGDWEDSDRGAGNKAKKRAGGKVEKKSPTYRAYVLNKEHHQKDANGKVIEHGDGTPSSVEEAKVEAGRSDYGKASVRNKRRFGKEGEPAIFDASGERGKMIDKRRAEHKAKRGVKEEVVTELNRYGKETGKATGSINKRAGTPVKKGGNTRDKALLAVRKMIRRDTGKPEGQRKKTKGEKGRVQYGDRKGTPADTIAKRRQSRADAEKLMRDTSGT